MPSSRSASASPFPDAGPPPDDLELSREFVEERFRVAKMLHDAREEIIRFQRRWPHELQVHDPLLDAVITHLRRFIPQMNRTGLVAMLNDAVLSNHLRNSIIDNGVWFPYAPELLFPQAERADEAVVAEDDGMAEPPHGQRATEKEVVAFLEGLLPGSRVPAEEAQGAEHAAEPSSSKVLGKRPHADEEDDDAADSPPPSPLKKQRHERSWSPSPSPGLSNSVLDIASPTFAAASTSAAAASARRGSSPSSPSSSPSHSPPHSPRAAGSSARRSHSRSVAPPGRRIIADHVRQPLRSPTGLPCEVSIMAIDIGNGGLEIFERREAQRRLAEYNATRAMLPGPAPTPARTPSPPPAPAPVPSAATPAPTVLPASAVPPVLAAPAQLPAPQPPVAGPSVVAPSTGTTYLTHGSQSFILPINRTHLTRAQDFTKVTYYRSPMLTTPDRRTGAPVSREAALEAERQMADRRAAAKRLQEEQEAAAAAALATTTAAGPSRTPKRSPKRRRATQESADAIEREEAAPSTEEERPAKRRSPSPPVAGPSKAGPSRRARKGGNPKDKGTQPVRRSTRNKGASS